MKNLSVLMFVILILGCDTETPVVEKPLPIVAQETYFIDIVALELASGIVSDGENNVDPVPSIKSMRSKYHLCCAISETEDEHTPDHPFATAAPSNQK